MEKVIRDGQVAILYSPGHGAGWSTWAVYNSEGLLFDPVIVDMVENKRDAEAIETYCTDRYGEQYYGGADQLEVAWLPVGTKFFIDEYDGCESVMTESDVVWTVA
jgi:hypothetical protein